MQNGRRAQAGFTYPTMLLLVALLGVGLAATGMLWRTTAQREKEAELLFIGHAFRRAIGSYHEATPGPVKQYPRRLEDLLLDTRQPTLTRHLRRIYADPMTGDSRWGLVLSPEGGIMGVYSLSEETPLKRAGFSEEDQGFEATTRYADWQFIYRPEAASEQPATLSRPKEPGPPAAPQSP